MYFFVSSNLTFHCERFETKLFNFYLRCDILPAENINISKLFQQYLCKSIRPQQAPHNIRHPL